MKTTRPAHTGTDYKAALSEVSACFDDQPSPETPDGGRFEIVLTLAAAYEARHSQVNLPDATEAIRFRMDQAVLTSNDLVSVIKQLSLAYEVLNRERSLTLNMIWSLHNKLGIPAESLIRPATARAAT